jgi:hypothetical protein
MSSKELIGALKAAELNIENTMRMDIATIRENVIKPSSNRGPVKIFLRTSEIAMIVVGGIIFLATVATLVVVCNIKQSK